MDSMKYDTESDSDQDHLTDLTSDFTNLAIQENGHRVATDLLERCEALLAEVEMFQKFLAEQKKDDGVEMRHFKNNVKSECKSLQRLAKADPKAQRTVHTLRSSNFPFYAAVWNAAKCSRGIIALEKKFYWDPNGNQKKGSEKSSGPHHKRSKALVDIVAQDGAEWIKVSSITAKRVFFDLAKAGWAGDTSSEESDRSEDEDDDEPEGLLKQTEALIKASKATRVRYRHPTIRIVLPKIERGVAKEVDDLLEQIEALDIEVHTSEVIYDSPPLAHVLRRMTVDPFSSFSETLNVDCTILLAMVSDLSHSAVAPEDWHHRAILRQIEMEKEHQLLPKSIWPACGSRSLVCTEEALIRMHEIVDLIGTESEKKRRDYLVEVESTTDWTKEERIKGFQELSAYNVPLHWNLPIAMVNVEVSTKNHQSPLADKVVEYLSPINKSVFLYGWVTGRTTISSNRTVAKEIEAAVESNRQSEDDIGPDIWLCPTARSLVGKEKTKRNWNS